MRIDPEKIKFHYYWADLIDRFIRANKVKKLEMTETFPYPDVNFIVENEIYAASIAGAVEELCKKEKIRIPDWVNEKQYFLTKPHYGGEFKGKKLRELLESESPEGFKRRNLFYSKNAITRV